MSSTDKIDILEEGEHTGVVNLLETDRKKKRQVLNVPDFQSLGVKRTLEEEKINTFWPTNPNGKVRACRFL